MLYAVHTGYVEGYEGDQREIVHLVSSVEQVLRTDSAWCFTDGHAVEAMTDFFDDVACLRDAVDWEGGRGGQIAISD